MIRAVFSVYLSFIVISVVPTVAQISPVQQCNVCQQNQYKNSNSNPANYQQASHTNPYSQPVMPQNQVSNQDNYGESLNQLLLRQILSNPCLQKILDPNTKLYNQNGVEIQRQPNTGTAPNVVNNYFIVPPEIFKLNNTLDKTKEVNSARTRKTNTNKRKNRIITNNNIKTVDEDGEPVIAVDREQSRPRNANNTRRGKRKRKRNKSAVKNMKIQGDIDDKLDEIEVDQETDNTTRRKQASQNKNKNEKMTTVSLIPKSNEEDINCQENIESPVTNTNLNRRRKRPRKLKTQPEINKDESVSSLEPIDIQTEDSTNTEKIMLKTLNEEPFPTETMKENSKDVSETVAKSEKRSQLKDIVIPVENGEQINNPAENRPTRNSKTEKSKNDLKQNITPIPGDALQNFFPYMYLGNYLYPNGNYPFNFEQFYQLPNSGRSNKRNRKRKSRKNRNKQNDEEPKPHVIEIKLKPIIQEVTVTNLTEKTITAEKSLEEIKENNFTSIIEITTEFAEPVTDIPMEIPRKVSPLQVDKKELREFEAPEKLVTPEANLEMPLTEIIEDLHEYMTPELGREDIVPIMYNNGIINDYYPIFYDDSYYTNDESYYVKDLDDDRFLYTTDRGHEEELNRDRRKYDRNEYRASNYNVKDWINFRRSFINDKIGNKLFTGKEITTNEPYIEEKINKQEDPLEMFKERDQVEDILFKSPPLLKDPDIKTQKMEKLVMPESQSREDYAEEINYDKASTYSDAKIPDFRIKPNSEIKRVKVPPKNTRPKAENVETVFAKSKVVKYGIPIEESDESSSTSMPVYDDNDSKHFGDGTTYVLAKSLGHVDDYYP